MKKSVLIYALIVCLILPAFVLVAQAHPGRTDSSGGHTDRSTGEYHYHHGYSAHDHYDMDSDGDIDCPYDFKNKTDSNNNAKKKSPTVFECILIGGLYVFFMFILPGILKG